jgi:hypothetical protein
VKPGLRGSVHPWPKRSGTVVELMLHSVNSFAAREDEGYVQAPASPHALICSRLHRGSRADEVASPDEIGRSLRYQDCSDDPWKTSPSASP